MILPEKLDVLTVHARLIAETGGTGGLRDEALLESALAAAYNRHHYESVDVVSCAATYAYHLTQAHAFFDVTNASLPPSRKHSWKPMDSSLQCRTKKSFPFFSPSHRAS